ncbi:hypothetical protein BDDG_12375, partial [Blastomyces dermatitidis ATCC 18188]
SSHVDRSVFTDDSEPSVELLIENLKNVIMKKLSVSCMTESSASLSVSSATSFSAASSQSSTLVSVSDSPALTTSVPAISTLTTSGFAVSIFLTSSSHFKEMLCRLSEPHFSRIISSLNSIKIFLVASVSEIILIKDDNITETTLSHSQAPLIASSLFSAEKIVHTSDYKHLISDNFCYLSDSASSSSSVSSAFTLSVLTPGLAGPTLFFNFSTYTH